MSPFHGETKAQVTRGESDGEVGRMAWPGSSGRLVRVRVGRRGWWRVPRREPRALSLSTMGTSKLTIGHFSDSHLGYEAYPALSASGNNQRGEDMVRSFRAVCEDILAFDPPLVIHAGDVTERPKVDIRYMLVAQHYFSKLAGIRPDGTRRQLVIVAGNHEQPRSRKEACWLELLAGLPGVTVVCDTYRVVRFDERTEKCPSELLGAAVHTLPHDTLKEIDFETVVPDPNAAANILVAHGVASGSDLFTRSLGREYAIDGDMLMREWDYVALGHFHKRGPVPSASRQGVERVWYSGSSEHVSFRDLRDDLGSKGYLRVAIDGNSLSVTPVDLPVREMFRLPPVDATGKTPEQIMDALKANLASRPIEGAVVGQIVEGVSRDLWSLIDVGSVRDAAKTALHYEITARYGQANKADSGEDGPSLGDLALIVEDVVAQVASANLRDDVRALTIKLLGTALSLDPEAEVSEQLTKVSHVVATNDERAATAEDLIRATEEATP